MSVFRKQNRLVKYDYSQQGYYFITVCTNNRMEYFGSVQDRQMILNDLGQVAQGVWQRTSNVYQDVSIDEFIIMPNHMHGIVILGEQATGLHYSLSKVIGSYKNTVTKIIRQQFDAGFGWQPSFYDHVIRKNESLDKIREYIRNNPLKWELDRNNPSNLWM